MSEHCVAWDPIPLEANRYMVLNVLHVEQMALTVAGTPVSLVVVSSIRKREPNKIPLLTWRIDFSWVAAYRELAITLWKGMRPYETDRKTLQRAVWEIAESSWLQDSVTREQITRQHLRHFVVTSSTMVYEFAAAQWSSSFLGDYQLFRARLQQRWVADHNSE